MSWSQCAARLHAGEAKRKKSCRENGLEIGKRNGNETSGCAYEGSSSKRCPAMLGGVAPRRARALTQRSGLYCRVFHSFQKNLSEVREAGIWERRVVFYKEFEFSNWCSSTRVSANWII